MNIAGILDKGCNKGILKEKEGVFRLTERGRKIMSEWSGEKPGGVNDRPENIMSYLAINFPEAKELSSEPPKRQSFFNRQLCRLYTFLYRPFQHY